MSPDTKPEHHRIDYPAFIEKEEFKAHRRRHRSFVFPILTAALAYYFVYVITATYASKWFSTPVFGNINVGLIFGLSQFLVTFVITGIYVSYANRKLDPPASELRNELEDLHAKGAAK